LQAFDAGGLFLAAFFLGVGLGRGGIVGLRFSPLPWALLGAFLRTGFGVRADFR